MTALAATLERFDIAADGHDGHAAALTLLATLTAALLPLLDLGTLLLRYP